jgi:hypothetical protein
MSAPSAVHPVAVLPLVPASADGTTSARTVSDEADPTLLAYAADLPTRYGIAHEVAGRRAKLVVPNSRRFRYLLSELAIPVALLGYATMMGVTTVARVWAYVAEGRWPNLWELGYNLVFGTMFAASTWLGFREWHRSLTRRTVIELDEDRLTILDHAAAGRPRTRSWPRERVGKVLAGPVPWTAPRDRGLGLHVHISGRTILEVMPGHEPAVAAWIADRLNEALHAEHEVDEAAVDRLLAGRA